MYSNSLLKIFMGGGHVQCVFNIVEFMLAIYMKSFSDLVPLTSSFECLTGSQLNISKTTFILFMKTFSSPIVFLPVVGS